ncbi:MAG TPA: guanine deaminase [Casimicrobiaceae bacterium]|jgi:guanine deaminase|nr:guanine deaminase [Casimicrobiaceae bacterium]
MDAATPLRPSSRVTAIRAAMLTFAGDPFVQGRAARHYEPDAIVAMADGRIVACGPAADVVRSLPPDTSIAHYEHALVSAGFVDAHVHYPQLPILGAGGKPLLDWLAAYTFPAECRFGDADHARAVAARYFDENVRNGITTACVFCTVHPESVDALFEEAARRAMRIVGGKVLMDRNAPSDLLDTAQRGYDESKALIERWHGRDRLAYAVTPRFAATSSSAQLDAAAALWRETPGAFVQSHLAENRDEVALIASLFPDRADYVDAYAHHGLLGRRAIYAHGIHLGDAELGRLAVTQSALAHCPTSNNFLGSGQFALHRAMASGVRVALGTDLGAGTSFSMFRTMQAACDVAHLQGHPLDPGEAWWMATGGGADALDLGDRIGRVSPGYDADLVVVDLHATPLLAFRMRYVADIDEALGVLLALGDDRAVRATYVNGQIAFDRDAAL